MKHLFKVVFVALILVLLSSATAWASSSEITIKVNGVGLSSEIPPLIVSGRTMVPMRTICESIGANVVWDQKNKTVIVEKNNHIVKLPVGSKAAAKDGVPLMLDVPAMLVSGRTLVPARFIAEAFGAEIAWQGSARTVEISFSETRDGKTPQQLLEASEKALSELNSYKFDGAMTLSSQMLAFGLGPVKIDMKMAMQGAFRKPQEVYSKLKIVSTSEESVLDSGLEDTEIYANGTEYYQRIGSGSWEKLGSAELTSLLSGGMDSNPANTFLQLQDIATIAAFSDDVLVAGRPHYVLYVKLDPAGFKNMLRLRMQGLSLEGASPEEQALANRMYDEFLREMRFDAAYKMFIDKETLIADSMEMRSVFKVGLAGQGQVTSNSDSAFSLFDFNQPVEMPKI